MPDEHTERDIEILTVILAALLFFIVFILIPWAVALLLQYVFQTLPTTGLH